MKKTWFTLAGLVPAMFLSLAFFAWASGPEPGSQALSPGDAARIDIGILVQLETPVTNADFTIEGTTLVRYTGTSETPVIPWGITEIERRAFENSKITSVSIPSSVTTIGYYAFLTSTLKTITVDYRNTMYTAVDGVLFDKSINILYAYPGGKEGSHYTIPASVTSIAEYAFAYSQLSSVNIPAGVTSIGHEVFAYSQLSSVNIPAGVTSIGHGAFAYSQLSSVDIPASVTSIGDYAFLGSQLSAVNIPSSVTTIGDHAFSTSTLKTITVDFRNTMFVAVDGVLFDKSINILYTWPVGKEDSHYTIPSSVTVIGDIAFVDSQLSSVSIPSSVTTIGYYAFLTSTLKTITVDYRNTMYTAVDGVLFDKSINILYAYPGGKEGSHYTIPSSVTAIGIGAFGYSQLSSVSIPESVTSIAEYAFSDCKNLTRVELSRGTQVADDAFEGSPVQLYYRD